MSGDKYPVMNDAKWTELRLGMYNLGSRSPKWRVKAMPSGYVSNWDGEWFHHFYGGGYSDIEWVEIEIESPEQELAVIGLLRSIHVPGHKTERGYKVYGYVSLGQSVDYV